MAKRLRMIYDKELNITKAEETLNQTASTLFPRLRVHVN